MSTIVCITVNEFFIAAGGGVCPQSVVKLFQNQFKTSSYTMLCHQDFRNLAEPVKKVITLDLPGCSRKEVKRYKHYRGRRSKVVGAC